MKKIYECIRNVCSKGRPTEKDVEQLRKFKEYLHVQHEAMQHGLSKRDTYRYSGIEVYGNENGEDK